MKMYLHALITSLIAILCAAPVWAEEKKAETTTEVEEQHTAHEHGTAALSIALGEDGLELMLDTPAANLLGFEHKPTSDADKKTVEDTRKKLEAVADLFTLSDKAECKLESTEVFSPLIEAPEAVTEEKTTDAKPTETTADKSAASITETKPDAALLAEKPKEDETGHSDVAVTWIFNCAKASELTDITPKLFANFSELKKLNVEWLKDDTASSTVLEKDESISFKQ